MRRQEAAGTLTELKRRRHDVSILDEAEQPALRLFERVRWQTALAMAPVQRGLALDGTSPPHRWLGIGPQQLDKSG